MKRIDVRIDRLVLDGVQLSHRERDALPEAIAAELRILGAGGRTRPALPNQAGSLRPADRIAREIAASIHGSIGQVRPAAGRARPAAHGTRPAAGRRT